jgi:hypothetical protein
MATRDNETQESTRTIVVAIIISVLALGSVGLIVWMNPPFDIMMVEELVITGVQFNTDSLNVTVRNVGENNPFTVTEVMVKQTQTYKPFILPGLKLTVFEEISAGEQVSINLNFNWTLGSAYRVRLETAKGNSFYDYAVAPVYPIAPIPLENPFNHPFWHRQSFAFEYW